MAGFDRGSCGADSVRLVLSALVAAAALAATPVQAATVRVPVANVWASPGAGRLPLDPHVWPTPTVTYAQRLALVGHLPTQALYGERVVVTGHRPGWTRIAIPDQPSPLDRRGYPGWVRSWQLGKPLPTRAQSVVVTRKRPGSRTGPSSPSGRGCRSSAGSGGSSR